MDEAYRCTAMPQLLGNSGAVKFMGRLPAVTYVEC
jgi:hypothetical protein